VLWRRVYRSPGEVTDGAASIQLPEGSLVATGARGSKKRPQDQYCALAHAQLQNVFARSWAVAFGQKRTHSVDDTYVLG